MRISKDLHASLEDALAFARDQRHRYVTAEHLLFVLCTNAEALRVLRGVAVNVDSLLKELDAFFDEHVEKHPRGDDDDPVAVPVRLKPGPRKEDARNEHGS